MNQPPTPTPPTPPSPESTPAHRVWVELATRASVLPLHYRSGEEESTALSLHEVFERVRTWIDAAPGALLCRRAALVLLNDLLRPYTSRWHRWLTSGHDDRNAEGRRILRFADEWYRRQFRRELAEVQPVLRAMRDLFAGLRDGVIRDEAELENRLAVIFTANAMTLSSAPSGLRPLPVASLGAPITAGLTAWPAALPIAAAEDIDRAERRELWRRPKRGGVVSDAAVVDATGLALSGGGIRSATFCLGIVQVLARRRLLPDFDYLSTVSGGGYLGAFLSSTLGAAAANAATTPQSAAAHDRIDATLVANRGNPEPPPVRHLRNCSRYLLDGKLSERCTGIGIVVFGVLLNLAIVLPLPALAAAVYAVIAQWGFHGDEIASLAADRSAWPAADSCATLVLTILGGSTLLAGLALAPLQAFSGTRPRSWLRTLWTLGALTAVAVALWVLPAAVKAYGLVRQWPWLLSLGNGTELTLTGIGTAVTSVLGVLASRAVRRGVVKWMARLTILVGPLVYLFVLLGTAYRLTAPDEAARWSLATTFAALAVAFAVTWLFVNVNVYSPHDYYRARLCSCYLVAPETTKPLDRLQLSELSAHAEAPYHLINAALNLPGSTERELRGRATDFFLFSKHYCGSALTGYYPTREFEARDLHLDLGTAMAISGAAVSSNMGVLTNHSARMLLTIANLRLGYWLPNPNRKSFWGPGPTYLLREMTGLGMNEGQRYWNVSDGGHIENLGVFELLRRRCKFIVCVDGGQEPGMECADLMRLERCAAIELGIRMHYDVSDLMRDEQGNSRAFGALIKIDYRPPGTGAERAQRTFDQTEWGWMLYFKLANVGYGPGYVLDYRRQNPDFPHQTTGDQVYDEGQFEAYRALGEFAAEQMFRVGRDAQEPSSLSSWFQALANHLLPDNDEAFAPRLVRRQP